MKKRMYAVFGGLILLFALAGARIYFVIASPLSSASKSFGSVRLKLADCRGPIFDCNDKKLVDGSYEYVAAVPPFKDAVTAVYGYLNDAQKRTLLDGYPISVEVGADFKHEQIEVIKVPERYGNSCAEHIIGYLDGDSNGVCGIEKAYNKLLCGSQLAVSFKTDAHGQVLVGKDVIVEKETCKNGVALTLDRDIQLAAEAAVKRRLTAGAAVVLENATGKIRAMVSAPGFDRSRLASYLDAQNSPFINRALCSFNTGSVFKLCVAAAALDNNISINHTCTGSVMVKDVKFKCLKPHGKGITMQSGVAKSCNTYFIELGRRLGADMVYTYAKSFGYGLPTELCSSLLSSSGALPEKARLKSNPACLANFSFGQGELMSTPLQVASMIQCITNSGRLIKPSLIEGITDEKGNFTEKNKVAAPTVVMKEQAARTLCEYMIYAVTDGTGKTAAPDAGGAGGKTATAETGISDGKGGETVQAWFGGFFPADEKKYTVVVLAENGSSGGEAAAPIFKDIADAINHKRA